MPSQQAGLPELPVLTLSRLVSVLPPSQRGAHLLPARDRSRRAAPQPYSQHPLPVRLRHLPGTRTQTLAARAGTRPRAACPPCARAPPNEVCLPRRMRACSRLTKCGCIRARLPSPSLPRHIWSTAPRRSPSISSELGAKGGISALSSCVALTCSTSESVRHG